MKRTILGSLLRRARRELPVLSGPAFVLGSGPGASVPNEFNENWTLATVNASQAIAARLGLRAPDVTLFGRGVIDGSDPANVEARKVLRGGETGLAICVTSERYFSMVDARPRLALLRYKYDGIYFLTRDRRQKLILDSVSTEIEGKLKPSNGVILALLCLKMGSSRVVMSGFSFSHAGHGYNSYDRPRAHIEADKQILSLALLRGAQIFAADAEFSRESGIPLQR